MAVDKLTPPSGRAPNVPNWFAAVGMLRLAADHEWLHKATQELARYWRQKREQRHAVISAVPKSPRGKGKAPNSERQPPDKLLRAAKL
jgi:hypothetical protein